MELKRNKIKLPRLASISMKSNLYAILEKTLVHLKNKGNMSPKDIISNVKRLKKQLEMAHEKKSYNKSYK